MFFFSRLLSHPDLISDKEWRIEQLQFLFEIGFCESDSIGVELARKYWIIFIYYQKREPILKNF